MIYVYREDINSPIAPAGNKLRKLAYVLPHALSRPGIKTLVTVGGVQSNCCRQAASVAAKLGLKCVVALTQDANAARQSHSLYDRTGNVQLEKLLGADVRFVYPPEPDPQHAREAGEDMFKDLKIELGIEDEESIFFLPQGAGESPSGGVGYARWVFEMLEQEATLRNAGLLKGSQRLDTIVVACATGGALAGMIAGMCLAEKTGWTDPRDRRNIIGIETFAKDVADQKSLVLQIARDTAAILGLSRDDIQCNDVVVDGRWTAGGYGVYDERTKATIQTAARTEALLLDPVYTGKAMTAVTESISRGELQGNILFVHTGGHVILPAYLGIEEV